MERVCLDCGTPIKGRSDKKFCDDQCRSNYNNRLKVEDLSFVRQVNHTLKKNRDILQKLNPTGKTKVNRDKLLKQGFDLNYHTHVYQTQKGTTYYFCYEYGYLLLNEQEVLLVKREEGAEGLKH
ncbi:MAG: hypothetical protein K0S09_3039 [Sphingobacteriaceae bacterium]|jgi:hypothetical protein|nr:hypothetical protein [Sphingobacteriaceae bacterium]